MKKVFLLIAAFCATNLLSAQNFIEKNFDHFVEQDNVTSVHVSGKMFQFAQHLEFDAKDQELNDLKEFVSEIESFDLIVVPELSNPMEHYKSGINKMDGNYDELLRVRNEDNNFSLYIDEENDMVREIVGIGSADKKFIVFSLLGNIDLSQVGKIIGKIQTEGFEKVNEVTKIGLDQVKVYPNPVGQSGQITLEVPENMIGGKANVYDMNGSLMDSYNIEQKTQKIESTDLGAGYYIVEVQKGDVVVKKKVAVVH